MRVPVSWLREYVDLPADLDAERSGARAGAGRARGRGDHRPARPRSTGPLVVGRVARDRGADRASRSRSGTAWSTSATTRAAAGSSAARRNFAVGDLVVVVLPGARAARRVRDRARKTYGHISDGMICSARELGIGDDHAGIIVLPGRRRREAGRRRPAVRRAGRHVVELDVTPDRGYCLSVRGMARELSHALGVGVPRPGRAPVARGRHGRAGLPGDASRTRRAATGSPPGPCAAIDPTAPSPDWMRRRLAAAGMRSISLAVDITNYLMLELGQPMHAFDLAALRGPLVVRRARPGETLTTLDGVERGARPRGHGDRRRHRRRSRSPP